MPPGPRHPHVIAHPGAISRSQGEHPIEAIILVGGLGTRLRPLTLTTPKPMIPVMNRPFLEHVVRWLASHGVDHLIFSTYHLPEPIRAHFGDGDRFGLAIEYSHEERALGTAGALKHAEPMLRDDRFIIFNGDILTDVDLTALMAHHRSAGAIATVALAEVADPSAYGMVVLDDAGRVLRWVEKPSPAEAVSPWVNLGGSILERRALDVLPPGEVRSLERDLYPSLIASPDPVAGFRTHAFWRDLGTPERYRAAHDEALRGQVALPSVQPDLVTPDRFPGVRVFGPVTVGSGTTIGAGTRLIGPACIGPDYVIGRLCTVDRAVFWSGVTLGDRTTVSGSIVGDGVTIGPGCDLTGDTVVGAGARIGAGNILTNGIRIAPGATLAEGVLTFEPR
ncbi:MAG: NDP-sugar synthase [Chloroflexota bacterium]|nr:NDP-sugar synthase [Chloroflexota bacterium]